MLDTDNDKRTAVICDIDNTILDMTHRYHMLKGKDTNWDEFLSEEAMSKDVPIWDTFRVISCLATRFPVIFLTGRNEGVREYTEFQLSLLHRAYPLLNGYTLIMRPDEDRERPDIVVKKELYMEYVEPYYNILVALDDKPSVVDLWRSLGITTYHTGELASGDGF